MRLLLYGCILACICFLCSCGDKKPADQHDMTFTRVDSLTDMYLALQDSILQYWNLMINDDNQKIKAMHNLLHELMISNPADRDLFSEFEERLEQLGRSRYTQKSMNNADVIQEYDFASASLINELVEIARSKREFSYNTTLQKLVNDIHLAEHRVKTYRLGYDSIVTTFNRFLDKNKDYLSEVDHDFALEKKPLFRTISDGN